MSHVCFYIFELVIYWQASPKIAEQNFQNKTLLGRHNFLQNGTFSTAAALVAPRGTFRRETSPRPRPRRDRNARSVTAPAPRLASWATLRWHEYILAMYPPWS